jgi:hypothetical protein
MERDIAKISLFVNVPFRNSTTRFWSQVYVCALLVWTLSTCDLARNGYFHFIHGASKYHTEVGVFIQRTTFRTTYHIPVS